GCGCGGGGGGTGPKGRRSGAGSTPSSSVSSSYSALSSSSYSYSLSVTSSSSSSCSSCSSSCMGTCPRPCACMPRHSVSNRAIFLRCSSASLVFLASSSCIFWRSSTISPIFRLVMSLWRCRFWFSFSRRFVFLDISSISLRNVRKRSLELLRVSSTCIWSVLTMMIQTS
ncbi:hypothetical protein COCCADRAFT_87050, partial [Bipolaris zeicola 26-R-13]